MREKIFFIDVDYDVENDKGIILLFGKNKEGKRVLVGKEFYTYFFAMPKKGKEEILKQKIENLKNLPTRILSVDIVSKNWVGEERKLIKITIQNPRKLKDVRDAIKEWEEVEETYEYNISFYKRFLMDYRIKPCSWIEVEGEKVENKFDVDTTLEAKEIRQLEDYDEPTLKVIAIDTEWVEVENKEKLIMISIASENLRKVLALSDWQQKQDFVESYASEEKLIRRFLEIIKEEKPDIIVTYNGDGFDFLKLREKAKQLKIKFGFGIDNKELEFVRRGRVSAARCFGVVHIDEYVFVDKILSASLKSEVLTLDEVASELIGEGKKDLEYKQMVEFWRERKELNKIAEYSMWDVHLTYLLSKILLPQIFSISRLTGEIPFDTSRYSYSQLVEAYLMRKAVEDNELIPNSPKTEEKEIRMRELPYKGAIVVEPKKGIHENVAVMDFRSVHPNELVVLMSPNGKIQISEIGKFVDNFIHTDLTSNIEVSYPRGWKVLCFDEKYKIGFRPISQVSRHKNFDKLIKITTKSGREIRVTGSHSLFTLGSDFEPKPIRACELKIGDWILIPKHVTFPEKFSEKINLLELIKIRKGMFLLGPVEMRPFSIKKRLRMLALILNGVNKVKELAKVLGYRHENVRAFIRKLKREGLVEVDKRKYTLTENGKRFLRIWRKLLKVRKYDNNRRMYKYELSEGIKKIFLELPCEKFRLGMRMCKHTINVLVDLKIFASLLGWYVAEGCMSKSRKKDRRGREYQYKVQITPVKKNDIEEVEMLLKELGFKYTKTKDGIELSSKLFYFLFEDLKVGRNAHEKSVPPFIFLCDNTSKRIFLESYIKGDGHNYGCYAVVASVSDKLITSLSILAASMNLYTHICKKKRENALIEGREITTEYRSLIIKGLKEHRGKWKSYNYPFVLPKKFCPFEYKSKKYVFIEKVRKWAENNNEKLLRFLNSDLALDEVVRIEEDENVEYVYDIGVNPTNNFICGLGGIIAHNSLYPTIIVSHSISPELLNCNHEECKEKNSAPETKNHFCIKKVGFIPKHLKFLIDRRKELKERIKKVPKDSPEYKILDNEQYATKIISNAMYGYFGFVGARWYKRECGEATAAWGRFYIRKIMQMAESSGFEIIYGDTDSIFVRKEGLDLKELGEEAKSFVEKVNEELPGIIELEFRGVYIRGIFVAREKGETGAKKRYALLDINGNLEIRGFETVRRDWCKLAKETQRKVLEIILKEKNPEKAIQFVNDTIKRIKEGKVDIEELTIYEQITKPLSQYEQIGPHVKAAMKAIERGKIITEGSVIAFVITKGSGSISDRAMPVEFVTEKDYDSEYYIQHQILPAALRVLKALGYTEQDVLKHKTIGLGAWFKK